MHWLLQMADYMPHGMCLLWRPWLMTLHVVSDAVIAAAYFAIPIGIAIFVRRRADLDRWHKAVAVLFVIFIAACGGTHLMSILVLWKPYYVAEGVLKAFTAGVSLVTACALPVLLPHVLRIPSPKALTAEIGAHRATLAELELARGQLAERVRSTETDLRETTRRFQAALDDSPVTLFEQDAELNYTWVYNPPLGLVAADLIGRTEAEVFVGAEVRTAQALKRAAMSAGEARRAEVHMATHERSGWFDMRVEPVTLRDGRPGLAATATDVTALKAQEEHLRLVMRELNHRAKNLLTIVVSITRQTARGFDIPPQFAERLQERLTSLARAHDVLAEQSWRGADLSAVIEGQLRHQIETYGSRITMEGGECTLPAEAAHYVGMALHELGSNAVKYGGLSGDDGRVAVTWNVGARGSEDWLELVWRESGGPAVVEPTRTGFGSAILKSLTAQAVGGVTSLRFDPEGVTWSLSAPLRRAL